MSDRGTRQPFPNSITATVRFHDDVDCLYPVQVPGVAIMQVAPGGAAEQAGLQGAKTLGGAVELGDVIVGIDNVEIHKSADLFKALDAHKVGDQLDITVENKGARRTVKVTLQPIP